MDLESLRARVFDGRGWNKAYTEGALIHDLWAEVERLSKFDPALIPDCPRCGAAHWPQCPQVSAGEPQK